MAVEAQERLLSGVLRLLAAAEHPVEQTEDVALVIADEPLERARVAGLPARDELGFGVVSGSEGLGVADPGGHRGRHRPCLGDLGAQTVHAPARTPRLLTRFSRIVVPVGSRGSRLNPVPAGRADRRWRCQVPLFPPLLLTRCTASTTIPRSIALHMS